MRVDTRPRYKLKETIVAKGMENFTLPYKGKVLEKTFDKGVIVIGNLSNYDRQNLFVVQETIAKDTIDKDTKQPFTGMVYFVIDPTKLEKVEAENQTTINAPDEVLDKYAGEDKEEKFWRNLGIKRDDFFKAKVKGRLYLAVVLVAGYFAYKKYKK